MNCDAGEGEEVVSSDSAQGLPRKTGICHVSYTHLSNSTRYNAIKDAKHGKTPQEKTSNSFEFTSYWADANNRVLTDLIDFTRTFFAKHTILSVLTRYCIFTSEKMLSLIHI